MLDEGITGTGRGKRISQMEDKLKTLEYSREDLYKEKEILDNLQNDLKLRITLLAR